jgi:tRNA-2-methylthio-N6-dimethylallyladenosine synthase
MSVLERVRFDMVYSFIYSIREGTRAASMHNQIPDEIKSARMTKLLDIQRQISHEKNLPYVNRVERVLVDSLSKNGGPKTYTARTATNKLVHFDSDENHIGEFIDLKIIRAGAFDLFGEKI